MYVAFIISIVFLIFPLLINLFGYYSKENNKFYFGIYLFNFIRILSGYVELIRDGIVIHYKNNKAKLIFFNNVFYITKSFKPIQDYNLISFDSVLEIGNENSQVETLYFAHIYNFISNNLIWFFNNKKPYLKIKNNVDVYFNENKLNFYLKIKVLFNMLTLLVNLIKILVEKIFYARKRKQN